METQTHIIENLNTMLSQHLSEFFYNVHTQFPHNQSMYATWQVSDVDFKVLVQNRPSKHQYNLIVIEKEEKYYKKTVNQFIKMQPKQTPSSKGLIYMNNSREQPLIGFLLHARTTYVLQPSIPQS